MVIGVNSDLASAVVILAHPSLSNLELSQEIESISDIGYDIGHKRRSTIDPPGFYSVQLYNLIGRLEMGGYTKGNFQTASKSLTENGLELLESIVLNAIAENAQITHRFAIDAGLNLNPILQKYIGKYLELKKKVLDLEHSLAQSSSRS